MSVESLEISDEDLVLAAALGLAGEVPASVRYILAPTRQVAGGCLFNRQHLGDQRRAGQ